MRTPFCYSLALFGLFLGGSGHPEVDGVSGDQPLGAFTIPRALRSEEEQRLTGSEPLKNHPELAIAIDSLQPGGLQPSVGSQDVPTFLKPDIIH